MESTDCGPACLQMVCAFYGKSVSQQYIKDGMSISRIGVTIRDIKDRASDLGFNSVVAKANIVQLNRIKFPVILHWNNNHFVLLYKVKKNRNNTYSYYIADPSHGKIKFSHEEFELNWLSGKEYGIVIFLKPTEKFYNSNIPKQKNDWVIALSLLKKYVPARIKVSKAIILLILSMACSWVIPYLYQSIIDNGVANKDSNLVFRLFFVQLSFFIGYTISNTLSSIILSKVNLRVGVEYIGELLWKIMRLPIKYFDTRLNTEFIQRLDDFNRVRSFLTDNLINTAFYLINAIVYFILLSIYSIDAVLIFITMSIVVCLWDMYFIHERKFIDYSLFTEKSRNRNLLYEIINNMPDIKINNAQKFETKKWEENQDHINSLILRQMSLNYKQNVGRNTMNRLRDIVIICFCCIITINGDLTLGVLMSISYILGQLGGPIGQIQSLITQYQMFKVSISRLSEVQRKENEQQSDQEIQINNVSSI